MRSGTFNLNIRVRHRFKTSSDKHDAHRSRRDAMMSL